MRSSIGERLALTGMALATVALAGLALWAAVGSQNGAAGLSRAGVQTSGHLRAVQALSMIDTQTDALEDGIEPTLIADLRVAQVVLDDALERMESGGVREATAIARDAEPVIARLKPDIERFLAAVRTGDPERQAAAEEEMEDAMEVLQLRLNNVASDPSRLLTSELARMTASERRVRAAAFVLLPVGLLCLLMCAALLRRYRRRTAEMLASTAREARTDQLTNLANRRAFLEEFERRTADPGDAFVLALADLNGFKHYNDTFGHAAGDALLHRLADKLARACAENGMAARLGGDEFCVLLPPGTAPDEARRLVHAALSEEGTGFKISAACGVVHVPADATTAEGALRLADSRMYAAKTKSRSTIEQLTARALVRVLDGRHPGLGEHVDDVGALAVACAETLGLDEEEVRHVRCAAELHDIGKLAIPEAIIGKPGPLDDDEWEYMRRHPAIGERLLAAIPSLERVAQLVRSSHERWDGGGYPDRLAQDGIPIGARIVAVADAYSAMTESRPYAEARTHEEAVAELRRCAGTQFDPVVVEAFVAALEQQDARRHGAAA